MILNGDALHIPLADCSVDSIVTDPPYGLSSGKTKYIGDSGSGGGFMGKKWDHGVPGVEFWVEALRVAKPGAHMLAFGGTRTYHRLACAIEDAGWEIRDCIMWVYGSGFPKSCNVSKQLDKSAGAHGEYGEKKLRVHSRGSHILHDGWKRPCQDDPDSVDRSGREYLPSTKQAKQWDGWGSALKPAYEPIILARKPLGGTIAQNVLKWGCGGINVDGSRIPAEPWKRVGPRDDMRGGNFASGSGKKIMIGDGVAESSPLGRFPANLIHDNSDEVVSLFPQNAGASAPVSGTEDSTPAKNVYGKYDRVKGAFHSDSGSAARFFYCAKASKADRDEGLCGFELKKARPTQGNGIGNQPDRQIQNNRNTHPTVKNSTLMRYLCKLITPPNGIILDPFCGSGSTGKAAAKEGFRFIGIEKEWEYCQIAKARCDHEANKPNQMRLAA